ncbi:hypothetical protein PBI_CORAL_34 [Arthrobacter phage Coral]|uniref:Uncharacterized protein n=2 Tax=Coralvirus coral TaxID=2734227 RepID=A0A3G2KF52_9CAUD|nr:hypothetical protein HOU54_gp34 [Arthrobacter phage Coral]AYN57509.1 hypothetical protein PBI_CORAL_34 [Arthrobacter phage Coral]AYN57609.1 hypothetical protein PBI_COTE_36 [Arthrobacter phage Cote]
MRVAQFKQEPDAYEVRLEGIGPLESPVAVAAAAYRCMDAHGIRPETYWPAGREIQAPAAVFRFEPKRAPKHRSQA